MSIYSNSPEAPLHESVQLELVPNLDQVHQHFNRIHATLRLYRSEATVDLRERLAMQMPITPDLPMGRAAEISPQDPLPEEYGQLWRTYDAVAFTSLSHLIVGEDPNPWLKARRDARERRIELDTDTRKRVLLVDGPWGEPSTLETPALLADPHVRVEGVAFPNRQPREPHILRREEENAAQRRVQKFTGGNFDIRSNLYGVMAGTAEYDAFVWNQSPFEPEEVDFSRRLNRLYGAAALLQPDGMGVITAGNNRYIEAAINLPTQVFDVKVFRTAVGVLPDAQGNETVPTLDSTNPQYMAQIRRHGPLPRDPDYLEAAAVTERENELRDLLRVGGVTLQTHPDTAAGQAQVSTPLRRPNFREPLTGQ